MFSVTVALEPGFVESVGRVGFTGGSFVVEFWLGCMGAFFGASVDSTALGVRFSSDAASFGFAGWAICDEIIAGSSEDPGAGGLGTCGRRAGGVYLFGWLDCKGG